MAFPDQVSSLDHKSHWKLLTFSFCILQFRLHPWASAPCSIPLALLLPNQVKPAEELWKWSIHDAAKISVSMKKASLGSSQHWGMLKIPLFYNANVEVPEVPWGPITIRTFSRWRFDQKGVFDHHDAGWFDNKQKVAGLMSLVFNSNSKATTF